MNDPYALAGAGLGLVALVYYIFAARSQGVEPNLVDGISLVLSGVGLLMGLKVCWYAYAFREVEPFKQISTQIFIGGIAITWVAIANAVKKLRF